MTPSEELQEYHVHYDPRNAENTKPQSKIMSRLHLFVSVLQCGQQVLCSGPQVIKCGGRIDS